MTDNRDYIGADYYQGLHDNNQAFMENNWLLDEIDLIASLAPKASTLIELGCGNGRFLEAAAARWASVAGVDWAKSAYIDGLLQARENISFIQADVATLKFPMRYDLVVSADFLEHLPRNLLEPVIAEAMQGGAINFHKIACYDDGHSHLSILPPEEWLAIFNSVPGGEEMRIVRSEFRKGNPKNIIVVLSNGGPRPV